MLPLSILSFIPGCNRLNSRIILCYNPPGSISFPSSRLNVLLVLTPSEVLSRLERLLPTVQKLGLARDVIFTGRIPDSDLPAIISGANVTISASVHEGFGLSAVESLACGTPLIAYQAGALQEAVGDAAVLLDDLNPSRMAHAIINVITQPDLRMELSQKGIIRAQKYQGTQNAMQTLQLYEDIFHEIK